MSDIMIKLKAEDDFMRVSNAHDYVIGRRNREYEMYQKIATEVRNIMECISPKFIRDKRPPSHYHSHYHQIITSVFFTVWRKHEPTNTFSLIKLDDEDASGYSDRRFVAIYEHSRWFVGTVLHRYSVTIKFDEAFEESHDFLSQLVIDLRNNKTVSVDSAKFQSAMNLADKLKGN